MNEAVIQINSQTPPVKVSAKDIHRFVKNVDYLGPIPDQTLPYYKGLGRCHLWKSALKNGLYGEFRLGRLRIGTHRFAWILKNGPIPKGLFVLHRCDNPCCVNPEHLRIGTAGDNAIDRKMKNRTATGDSCAARKHPERLSRGNTHYSRTNPEKLARGDRNGVRTKPEKIRRGERSPHAKISEAQAIEIKKLRKEGVRLVEIASNFSVSIGLVHAICAKKCWKHLD